MSFEILVPSLPESVADATLVSWHKQIGEWVNEGDSLADLETDKVILEVPAQHSGTLTQILKQNGEIVVAGEVLALLEIQTAKPGVQSAAASPIASQMPPIDFRMSFRPFAVFIVRNAIPVPAARARFRSGSRWSGRPDSRSHISA